MYVNKSLNGKLNYQGQMIKFFQNIFEAFYLTKGALSGLRSFLANESPLKNNEKCFLHHLKSSFRCQDT